MGFQKWGVGMQVIARAFGIAAGIFITRKASGVYVRDNIWLSEVHIGTLRGNDKIISPVPCFCTFPSCTIAFQMKGGTFIFAVQQKFIGDCPQYWLVVLHRWLTGG